MPNIEVIGVLPNRDAAEQTIANLRLAGFPQQACSLIVVTREESRELAENADQNGDGAKEVVSGITKGVAVGSITGLVAGGATLFIPGLGSIVGWGILLALFGGTGAFVGALSGAFSSETVSEEVIERYGMALREGQSIVSVTAPNADVAKHAEEVFRGVGATNVNSYLEDQSEITDEPGIRDITHPS